MGQGVKVLIGFVTVVAVSAVLVFFVLGRGAPAPTPGPVRHVVIEGSANSPGADPRAPDENMASLGLPAFELIDQAGSPVTDAALKGHVTIVDFFFTRCTFICPMLTGRMIQLSDNLKGTPARFMSISVDSEHDTPEVLRAYAKEHDADLSRWTFVTGDKKKIWGMLHDNMKWGIEERPEQPIQFADGTSMPNIAHPNRLFLFGPDGRLLTMAASDDDEALARLEARARAVIAKMNATK